MASTKQAANRIMWVGPTGKKEIVTPAEAERRVQHHSGEYWVAQTNKLIENEKAAK